MSFMNNGVFTHGIPQRSMGPLERTGIRRCIKRLTCLETTDQHTWICLQATTVEYQRLQIKKDFNWVNRLTSTGVRPQVRLGVLGVNGWNSHQYSPTTGCKRNRLVTVTISSHLFVMWAIERWRARIIIIHSPGNPSFLYGHTYCYPVGGLPWELSKPDMAVATAAVSVCC